MRLKLVCVAFAVALSAAFTFAEVAAGPPAAHAPAVHSSTHTVAEGHDAYPHPVVSEDAGWAGRVVWAVVLLFLGAALVGPVVRANAPEEVPPAHSHDEPPGASHHHGSSGTHSSDPH